MSDGHAAPVNRRPPRRSISGARYDSGVICTPARPVMSEGRWPLLCDVNAADIMIPSSFHRHPFVAHPETAVQRDKLPSGRWKPNLL